ncbi:MAG TPA: sugar ABC transporter substrate-binding protein [Caldilineaceae bacterium]|nr:sugar ABC transporter substrate-binding protein [Caldilineaceae bacterium]
MTVDRSKPTCSRRAVLKWMGLTSSAALLAACTPAAPQTQTGESPAEGAPAGEGALAGTLSVLTCCYTPPEVELREAFNAKFAEEYPGATVEMELLPAGQNYFEKLQTLFAANTAPDLFDMWEGYIQPYAANGALLNMDPFLEADGEISKEDLLPAAVEAASWQGSIYALSIGFMPGPISIYFNTAHFDAAGVEYPSAEWTWDQMREAARALTADTNSDGVPDQWGLAFELWFVPWLYWIWSNGGDVFNEEETRCILTEPPAVEAIQYWADLVLEEVALPPSMAQSMQGTLNAFQTGAVSMYLGNTWDVATLKEAQDLPWKAVLSPKANNGNRIWYEHFWCWAISTQSQKQELAWQYARDFVLERVIDPATPTIPPLQQLLDTFDTPTNRELGYTPLISLATEPDQFRIPGSGAKWDKISGIIQAELDLVFLGEQTAAQAAENACPKVDEELARA